MQYKRQRNFSQAALNALGIGFFVRLRRRFGGRRRRRFWRGFFRGRAGLSPKLLFYDRVDIADGKRLEQKSVGAEFVFKVFNLLRGLKHGRHHDNGQFARFALIAQRGTNGLP